MLTKQAEGGRPTKKTKQNPLFGMIPLIELNPSCSSSPGHRVALWCSCDVLLSLSLSLSPACLRTKMVDRQRKSCTFFAFERQRWNSNCYMTRPPCEEITQYQREINCRVFLVFFKRTCNTHPWISNEILGSRLRPGIIYSKVCIVKWFPLIKCTLTKRLRHFFFHIISAIAIPQLHFFFFFFGFMMTDTEWWLWSKKELGGTSGIYNMHGRTQTPCPVYNFQLRPWFHTDKH